MQLLGDRIETSEAKTTRSTGLVLKSLNRVGGGNWMTVIKRYKFTVINTEDVMYNTVTIVNTAV